jgi:hypothetical protein
MGVKLLVVNPERKCHLKELYVNGRIILIWTLNEYSMWMGAGFISVDIWATGEVL